MVHNERNITDLLLKNTKIKTKFSKAKKAMKTTSSIIPLCCSLWDVTYFFVSKENTTVFFIWDLDWSGGLKISGLMKNKKKNMTKSLKIDIKVIILDQAGMLWRRMNLTSYWNKNEIYWKLKKNKPKDIFGSEFMIAGGPKEKGQDGFKVGKLNGTGWKLGDSARDLYLEL